MRVYGGGVLYCNLFVILGFLCFHSFSDLVFLSVFSVTFVFAAVLI